MKLLDLSKFEKVAEDKHTATMRHKDGHTMTIVIGQLPKLHQEQLKRIKLAGGGMAKDDDAMDDDSAASDDTSSDPSVEESSPVQFPAAQALSAAPGAPAPIPGNLGNVQNAQSLPEQALQMGARAADAQQSVDTAAAQGKVGLAEQDAKNQQDILNRQNATINEMKQHTDAFADWTRQNPVNNNAYVENMSLGQKGMSAVGLILGGIGGSHNPAMDYLNKQIDRNIAGQKDNYERQRNVYGAYQSLYGDENVSTALTGVSMRNKLMADSDRLTATLGTPQAQKNNMLFKADLMQKNAADIQKAAFIKNAPGGQTSQAPSAAMERGAGAGQKPMNGQGTADSMGVYKPTPLLAPGAAQQMNRMEARASAGDPMAVAQLPRIQEQYARAGKADEVISRARDLYSTLANSGTQGGWISRNVGDVGGGGDGIVGTVANLAGRYAGDLYSQGSSLADKVTGSGDKETDAPKLDRDYNTAAQELSDLLRSVYPGIGGGELHQKLSGILPDHHDTPMQVKAKEKAFEDLIRTSGEFGLLKDNGMMQ